MIPLAGAVLVSGGAKFQPLIGAVVGKRKPVFVVAPGKVSGVEALGP